MVRLPKAIAELTKCVQMEVWTVRVSVESFSNKYEGFITTCDGFAKQCHVLWQVAPYIPNSVLQMYYSHVYDFDIESVSNNISP